MELLQMFYGGEPFSFCLPDEGQIYGVTWQCHSRVQFWKHTRTLPPRTQTHTQTTNRWVVPDVFRFCRLPSGRQSAGVHSWCGLTLSAASVPHALNLDLEDELGFQKAVFHQKSLAVCVWSDTFCCFFRIIGFSQWMWPVRGRGGYQLKWFLLLPIWRLADDGKTTFVTDRFSRSMLLLSSKAMDDSVAPCGSLHCVHQNMFSKIFDEVAAERLTSLEWWLAIKYFEFIAIVHTRLYNLYST